MNAQDLIDRIKEAAGTLNSGLRTPVDADGWEDVRVEVEQGRLAVTTGTSRAEWEAMKEREEDAVKKWHQADDEMHAAEEDAEMWEDLALECWNDVICAETPDLEVIERLRETLAVNTAAGEMRTLLERLRRPVKKPEAGNESETERGGQAG